MLSITRWSRRALVITCAAFASTVGLVSQADAHETEQGRSGAPSTAALAACPVGGPAVYTDSWGDPRSGGRRHEGVDMEAARGTPVVAVRSGAAEFKRSGLGGNAVWLVTPAGERFYYAHLDAWEGDSREVIAGEIIGYVGQTGNAAGDHLHFEARLGDTPTNPYPLVTSACYAETDSGHLPASPAPTTLLVAR
jgi:murein DD-endopeptidase MepM/ murein hydrolase activator NlpD